MFLVEGVTVPSVWRVRKVKGRYYLYHRDRYVGPIEEVARVHKDHSRR